jgi:hypothetical protein
MEKLPVIDSDDFYDAFIAAAKRELGPQDKGVDHAIIGFDFGGPTDLLSFSNPPGLKKNAVYFVTTDLIFQDKQPQNSLGRYELAMCANEKNRRWAHGILSHLALATMDEVFDENHTVDITIWVDAKCPVKGLLLSKLFAGKIKHQSFGALLCLGLTKPELDFALEHGSEKLLDQLKAANIFPITNPKRASIIPKAK